MSKSTGTVLVTGGTAGMGYECALKIAQQCPQYQVLIASRSNNDNAAVSINQRTGHRNVEYLTLDLSNLVRVRSFAADYAKKGYPQIKALVLNAGLQILDLNYTEDKIESTFAINHVGHALLFYLMRTYLAEDARILITSSGTHDPAQKSGLPDAVYNSAEELAQPTKETGKYSGRQRYATSKLCNIMWMYALHRRLERTSGKKWTVNAFDPGLMPGTGLTREAPAILQFIWHKIMPRTIWLLRLLVSPNIHSPRDSGASLARLAVGDDVKQVSGKYYEGQRPIPSSKDSQVVEKQEDLWEWTVERVAKDDQERRDFENV
ncbi:hypothetical protein HO133_010340 [Letharia lupina]|uniref:NAD(P)-binding protein n=1 Tax=Letharia lupina TaxID=560253 RepID=A0A8H6CKJ2_9LECA|nr:uncharacterized protein HO133_010340 [Letharia lupina]KAF6225143.1 hypothetical protein HO133_010340 [Letharia lupina]